MRIIEPCCYHKQIGEMAERCLENKGAESFFSYSDWTFSELLSTLVSYSEGGEVDVAMARADLDVIEAVGKALKRSVPDKENPAVQKWEVGRMVLVTQPPVAGSAFDQRGEIREQLGKYIREGRLCVCEDNIGFRCIAVRGKRCSLAVEGSLNTKKSGAMQLFMMTASENDTENLKEMFAVKERTKKVLLAGNGQEKGG